MTNRALDNKCPACGAPILYKPNLKKWKCDYCKSEFTLEEMKKYNNASNEKNNIKEEVTLDFILKVNSYVSRNESLSWGELRTGNVGISGTDYIPKIPEENVVKEDIKNILEIPDITLRSIKYMLYGMRNQLFWDGNKRTSMIIANKIMIMNGKGIILVKDDDLLEFNKLLTEYYTTGVDIKIIEFLYNKCVYGLE